MVTTSKVRECILGDENATAYAASDEPLFRDDTIYSAKADTEDVSRFTTAELKFEGDGRVSHCTQLREVVL
jgi:hypothetical protein